MHNAYADIVALADALSVQWWDENGVPRFARHHPRHCPDIYAGEVALLLIACQGCHTMFTVQMSMRSRPPLSWQLARSIADGRIHYGDPPNIGCCPAGPTMSCDNLRVLEYWRRDGVSDWERMARHEIELQA